MAEIITQQLGLFLISILYGIFLGLWYDIFRTFRKKKTHSDKMVHMEDIIYCLSSAAGLFLLLQIFNQGRMRLYILAGMGMGLYAYFKIFVRIFAKILSVMVGMPLLCLKGLHCTLGIPVKLIINFLTKTLKKTMRTVRIIKSRK